MFPNVLAKIFGTKADREIKALQPLKDAINGREPHYKSLSDAELAAKTAEFKQQLEQGASLDDILPEAFAVVRETGRRILNMRHYDVQLIGGMELHKGRIAEMKTGEGKTLVATLPVYLNALAGKGVHVVTVNDYLAKRDAEWMGRIYKFLGLTVGCITHDISDRDRRAAYQADITYGTNNEFGFDYLRDNMKFRLEDCVQRGHFFAIVDEVDSILIDEARTPLIISGPSEESTDKYYRINKIIPRLVRGEVIEGKEPGEKYFTGDYTMDEKHRTVALTEEGVLKVERLLGLNNLYEAQNIEFNHHVQQALKAHVMYTRDKDYVVRPGDEEELEVIIVDEFTGRLMPGRRWSDGLHQAIEAKENVKIQRENQTLATITFQNYFRMYAKLAGMTGTADTEAAEFGKTYKLDVTPIPPNRVAKRQDANDIVYRTEEEKFRNAAKEIKERNAKGQPVLVGTISVTKSEKLSSILTKMGVEHEVLNAKNHEREAYIIAQAGRYAAVTVSTNMAGRGTDILLGGNPDFLSQEESIKRAVAESVRDSEAGFVADERFYYFERGDNHYRVPLEAWQEMHSRHKAACDAEREKVVATGGLCIIGTERHESRRIDNQLRGRSGRQGDPGSSRFFLSLQDDLLRIFGGERMQNLMLRLGMEEDVPIDSGLITKRIAAAQKAVEAQNFASRKHVLEYDDVMNKQRGAVYTMRRNLLEGTDQKERIFEMAQGIIATVVGERIQEKAHPEEWDITGLESDILTRFGAQLRLHDLRGASLDEVEDTIFAQIKQRYDEKESLIGAEYMREAERVIMLNVIDNQWKDHLLSMDHLKEGIGLRGYGQKDPLLEYKKESFTLFQDMMDRIEDETIRYLFFLQIADDNRPDVPFEAEYGDDEPEDGNGVPVPVEPEPSPEDRQAARAPIDDFTRNIQKKKERELADLQFLGGEPAAPKGPVLASKKPGRNDACWCGSGKKYKKCHGVNE
ncbi:MAG TPA: preprotein translocase subunit SecA [Bryobacteraceae bacterium]|nr:preprotein translocase subunit SecA [Bryobacteraceae bacterium]